MGAKGEFRFIEPPDFLKKKIVKGEGLDWKTIDSNAQATLETMQSGFLDHLRREIGRMDEAMQRAQRQGPSECLSALRELYEISHNLRGQGSTFDYPLITAICGTLCDFIEQTERFQEIHLEAIEIQLSAIKAVVAGEIVGDGGTAGRELLSSIEELVVRARKSQRAAKPAGRSPTAKKP